MFRIGIARVSTKTQQRSGNSLSEQVQRLRQYDSHMPIYEFAQSAYNKSIFPHIIQHIKNNTEIVVLYCDRLSRNVSDCSEFITKNLIPKNSYVYSISENIRTNTKTGKLEFLKKIVDGETLSHNLSLRVKDGLKHSKKKQPKKKYGSDNYENKNIKIIMDLYNDKIKYENILKYLKDNKINKFKDNSNKNKWSINFIKNLIKENKNKTEYKNKFNFNEFKKELEIIDKQKNTKNEPEAEEDCECECFIDCSFKNEPIDMDIDG